MFLVLMTSLISSLIWGLLESFSVDLTTTEAAGLPSTQYIYVPLAPLRRGFLNFPIGNICLKSMQI
jgi:hypothetical protein